MILNDAKVDENLKIVGYSNVSNNLRMKLLTLGLTKGTKLKSVNIALPSNSIEISVRGYFLLLRKDEAMRIKMK